MQWPLVVGHNLDLEELAGTLLGAGAKIRLPTAGLVAAFARTLSSSCP